MTVWKCVTLVPVFDGSGRKSRERCGTGVGRPAVESP